MVDSATTQVSNEDVIAEDGCASDTNVDDFHESKSVSGDDTLSQGNFQHFSDL